MTLDEIKSSVPDTCLFFYDGLTQEQAFTIPVESWCGQSKGIWYAGTLVEVPELAAYRIG